MTLMKKLGMLMTMTMTKHSVALVSSPDSPDFRTVFTDAPMNPDKSDDKLSSSLTQDSTDYPLTQATPVYKSTPALQASSSSFEMFLSNKT